MKAKKTIGLLASIGVLLGSLSTSGLIALADTPASTVKTVLQDFSTLADISYDDGSYSDPLIRGGNHTGLERIENADGTYSLGVKTGTGGGTASPASTQVALTNRAPADTKAIALRLTMPEGQETDFTDAKTFFVNSLYVDTPAGRYNVYLQHAWNGVFINANAYGHGYESNPVDCYLIDAATGETTKRTLNGPAMYEGYNFLNLNGFDGWVVIPMEYWMDHSGYDGMPYNGGTYPGTLGDWATGEGDILYTSLDPAKINTISLDMSGAAAGYNPVYHEIAAISDITAFVDSFKTEPAPEPVNGKLVLQDFSNLTDLQDASGEAPADPIFLGQYNGFYNNSWNFDTLNRIENEDGTYSLGVKWNGVETWRTPATVYVKFDNAAPAETKAIAVKLSLTTGTNESAQNELSAFFPYLFPATNSGNFSAYLKYAWKGDVLGAPGYEDNNVTVYRIDTKTGEKAAITLKDLAEQGTNTIFDKGSFEGWVIIPLEYWMSSTNYNSALPNESWVGDAAGHFYETMAPEKLIAITLGMGNSEDGYESVYHEIAAITDIDEFMGSFAGDIEITAQPEDVIVSSGETATFNVTATSGSTITYQWQKSVNNGEWTDIEGANTATYTTPATAAADNNTRFRCVLTSEGAIIPTTSNAATLYVDKYPDVVIDYEIGSNPISADVFEDAKGKNVNIIINVKDGGETVYTWTINGKDITNAVAFNPEIEVKDVADIALDEIAPDALYFETKQTGKLPGKASLKLDTSFNFFEGEDLWLYSVDTEGKLTFVADGMVSGMSTSEVTLIAAGSYVLNNVKIDGAAVPTEPGDTDSSNSNSDVTDTGLNDIVVLLAVALFGIALTTVVISKKSVKTK